MKQLAALLFVLSGLLGQADEPQPVLIKQGDREKVLILFNLTPDNIDLEVPKLYRPQTDEGDRGYRFKEGGQLDAYIKREFFPIQIPESCCDSNHVLTMPYTNPFIAGGTNNVAKQRKLFNQIKQLKESGNGKVPVAIDLTYYAKIESHDPLKVKLKERQIYFRHHMVYIEHANLTSTDNSQ